MIAPGNGLFTAVTEDAGAAAAAGAGWGATGAAATGAGWGATGAAATGAGAALGASIASYSFIMTALPFSTSTS